MTDLENRPCTTLHRNMSIHPRFLTWFGVHGETERVYATQSPGRSSGTSHCSFYRAAISTKFENGRGLLFKRLDQPLSSEKSY